MVLEHQIRKLYIASLNWINVFAIWYGLWIKSFRQPYIHNQLLQCAWIWMKFKSYRKDYFFVNNLWKYFNVGLLLTDSYHMTSVYCEYSAWAIWFIKLLWGNRLFLELDNPSSSILMEKNSMNMNLLCSTEESKSYSIGPTCGWVNDDFKSLKWLYDFKQVILPARCAVSHFG